VTAASESIEYRRQNIRGADFLLPKFSELAMSGAGNETRNRTEFSACRPYTVASALRFSPPAPVVEPKPVTNDAPPPIAADPLLLERVKTKAAENLQRLPNYTCTQTIERSRRGGKTENFDLVDRLRLEVALVDGGELFSWPGASKFEEKRIGEIVGGGTISNGNFALHEKGIFLSPATTFTYAGEEVLNGRRALLFDYRVPQPSSIYRLRRTVGNEAFVGHHGTFWVAADTLDLIRLEVHADDIPPSLDLAQASDAMEYSRLHIGDGDFLLPKSSEFVVSDVFGNENRNRAEFSACRQYTGESVISFDVASTVQAAPARQAPVILVPGGVRVEVRLQTPIDSYHSARGDLITAVVGKDARNRGKIVAPKGALLTGRITRLEKRSTPNQDYFFVGLDFTTIEFGGGRGEFRAAHQFSGPGGNFPKPKPGAESTTGGVFVVRGSHVSLPRGHPLLLLTEP
jgi:hypothetical protein